MALSRDILLNDTALKTASDDMKDLKKRAEDLKKDLKAMYQNLTTALDTPAGNALQLAAEDVLIEPIDKMITGSSFVSLHILPNTVFGKTKGGGYSFIINPHVLELVI